MWLECIPPPLVGVVRHIVNQTLSNRQEIAGDCLPARVISTPSMHTGTKELELQASQARQPTPPHAPPRLPPTPQEHLGA